MAEKVRLERMGRTGSWGPAVAEGPTLHPGEQRPAGRGGCGPGWRGSATSRRRPRSPARVRRRPRPGRGRSFQRDYGLNDDGVVGAMTLAAMNAPIETRLAQVAVNLERLRWMNGDPEPRYLLVNIPDFTVTLWRGRSARLELEGGRRQDPRHRDAGVRRGGQTIVVNPTWHIPDFDRHPRLPAQAQAQPDGAEEPGHRPDDPQGHGHQSEARRLHPVHAGELPLPHQAAAERRQRARRGQVPVPEPASRSTCTTRRTASSSRATCAPSRTAASGSRSRSSSPHILLAGQSADPEATYASLRAGGKEKSVALEETIPVHIVYRTVTFGEDGAARYRPDVYGRDARIFEALEAAGVTLPTAQG